MRRRAQIGMCVLASLVVAAAGVTAWELAARALDRRVSDAEARMAQGDYGTTTAAFQPPDAWKSWMPTPSEPLDLELRLNWDAAFPRGSLGYGIAQFRLPVVSRWRGRTMNSGGDAGPDLYFAAAEAQPDMAVSWLAGENELEISAVWGGDTGRPRPGNVTVRLVVADGAAYGRVAARLYAVSGAALALASVTAPPEAVGGPRAPLFTVPRDDNDDGIADAWEQ